MTLGIIWYNSVQFGIFSDWFFPINFSDIYIFNSVRCEKSKWPLFTFSNLIALAEMTILMFHKG